jgi:branched chain amino acid efflux pump
VTATVEDARGRHPDEAGYREGIRAGLPLAVPTGIAAIAFGVLAAPVMGHVAAIVMSLVVYAGSAQFTALSVLAGGGGAGTAVLSGLLMNGRFLPMGIALAPWLRGGRLRRAVKGQAVIDASWAIANRGDGRFDPRLLIGSSVPQFVAWQAGTVIGVLAGDALPDAEDLGLDAVFPAFFLILLVEELRSGRHRAAAALGALLALALLPWAPTGVPILASALAALIGLRR